MAGLLTGFLTGAADRRDKKQQEALERQRAAEEKAESDAREAQRKIDNARNATLDSAAAAQQKFDNSRLTAGDASKAQATTADATQTAANKAFENKLQLPPHWSKMSDADKTNYLQQRQNAAQRAGDDAVVKQTQDMINGLASDFDKYSMGAAAMTRADATSDYDHARAEFTRTAHSTAIQIAGMNNSMRLRVATAQIAGRLDVANVDNQSKASLAEMNNAERSAVAEIAGAYKIKGESDTDAIRLAIANRNNQTQVFVAKMRAASSPTAPAGTEMPLDPTSSPLSMPPASPVQIYLGGLPAGTTTPPGAPPAPPRVPGAPPRAPDPRAASKTTPSVPDTPIVTKFLGVAQGLVKSGKTVPEVRALLMEMVPSKISASQAQSILQRIAPQRPVAAAGGSAAPGNF